jgi:hypothetical protein
VHACDKSPHAVAGGGLEAIAPNLLLFLVLQEYPPDVPTLFPTLDTRNAHGERTSDVDLQRKDSL